MNKSDCGIDGLFVVVRLYGTSRGKIIHETEDYKDRYDETISGKANHKSNYFSGCVYTIHCG